MLCHNKKRQRLKEYINYKLNKYYTVIFTLIIWDFLSFFFLFVLCSSKYWPFILFPTILLPPMGPFHKPVNTKLWKPIVLTHYIRKVLCTQKKSCIVCYCTTEVWNVNMSLNQVGDGKPEEVTACKQASLAPVETFFFQPEPQLATKTNTWNIEVFTHWIDPDGEQICPCCWLKSIKSKWYSALVSSITFPRFPWLLVTVLLTVSNVMQLVTPYRGSG